MSRPEIWLGDLLRVLAELEPTGGDAVAVERMLGLRPAPAETPTRTPGAWDSSARKDQPAGRQVALSRGAGDDGPEGPIVRPTPHPEGTRTEVAAPRIGSAPVQPPPWDAGTTPMPAPDTAGSPPPEPILSPLTRRGILSAAVATRTPDGPPDLDRILDTVTRGTPLREVPRVPVASLRRGAQVLADSWTGMAPYVADRDEVLEGLRRVLGPERVELLWFAGDPSRGAGPGPRDEWRPWTPPRHGTPVLVVSDLGLGGPLPDEERAPVSAWVELARVARNAGCPVVALVPFGPARWPRALSDALMMVHWSERLTAGAVRRAVGRGHGVPR